VAFPGLASYAASKAGVLALTRCAAVEYAEQGVRVNAICPGIVDTPMTEQSPTELVETGKTMTPLRRIARADELAAVALFLASDESAYMTGAALPVDGGYTAL